MLMTQVIGNKSKRQMLCLWMNMRLNLHAIPRNPLTLTKKLWKRQLKMNFTIMFLMQKVIETNIIPYTSTSITLPHLCQGCHDHCVVTSSDGGDGKVGNGSFTLGFGWGTGSAYHIFFYFLFCFCGVVNCSFMAGT